MLHFLWRKFPFTLNLKSVYLWEAQAKNMQIWGTMQMGDLLVTAVISVPLIIIIAMMKSYILKSIVQVSLNPSDPSLGGFDWKPHLAHGSTAVPTTRQFRFNLTTFRQLFLFSLPQPHKDENRLIHTGLPVTKRQTDAFTATNQTLHNNCFLVEHNPVSCVLRQLSQQ